MTDSISETDLAVAAVSESSEQSEQTEEIPEGEPAEDKKTLIDILLSDAPQDDGTYTSHPLNYDGKESTAKIVRGGEGFLGDLNKAILLVLMGLVEKYQETREQKQESEGQDLGGELEDGGPEV